MKQMRVWIWIVLLLALSASAQAQNRPLVGSTVQTTDTSANSLLVGCSVGSVSCTGGIKAGPATLGSTLAVTGATTLTSTLTVNSTSASAIDVAGGINAGSGNVGIVDTSGRIPALTSTYFASLDGSTITNIAEANIADGTIFPRLAANETITANGGWTFSGTAPQVSLSNATSNWILWSNNGVGAPSFTSRSAGTKLVLHSDVSASSADFAFGIESGAAWWSVATTSNAFRQYGGTTLWSVLDSTGLTLTNAFFAPTGLGTSVPAYSFSGDTDTGLSYVAANTFSAVAGGTRVESWSTLGVTFNNAVIAESTISPAALPSGNTNDYNPTSLSSTFALRLVANAANSTLTGLAAQAAGSIRLLCNAGGAGNIVISNEDANSSAANRFQGSITIPIASGGRACAWVWYDGGSSRWRAF
jgi:hypothetical protein